MKELIIIDNYNEWSIPVRREDDLTIAVLLCIVQFMIRCAFDLQWNNALLISIM